MIVELRRIRIRLPRKNRNASKFWQRWFVVLPFFGYVEGSNRRHLILPGWHETRVSQSQHRRVWKELDR